MLDTILIANSGLNSHQKGLRTISDNVANMNTPGFKGSHMQFADVFLSESGDAAGESADRRQTGGGVQTLGGQVNFTAGEFRNTGRTLDTAIDGAGFFVVEDAQGHLYFTKSGRFSFNDSGELVTQDQGYKVKGYAGGQSLTSLSDRALQTHEPLATSKVTFTGNLTTQSDSHTIDNINVFDAEGGMHTLSLTLARQSGIGANTWKATIKEGASTLSSGQEFVVQSNGPDPTAADISFSIQATNGTSTTLTFTLGADVTALSLGSTSSLRVREVNGYAPGTADSMSFDEEGLLTVQFSNGQSRKGGQLAIAEFATPEALRQVSGTLYELEPGAFVRYAQGGVGSTIRSSTLELSNVDLTNEFSDLVLIQRGYQASSQVLSTANEMLQQLFEMKGRR